MAEQKRTCGQCELYLNKKEKCPHQEKTAFSEGCEIFVYTNPEVRIDGLQAELEKKEQLLKRWLERNENLAEDNKKLYATKEQLQSTMRSAIDCLNRFDFEQARTLLEEALKGY